MTARDNFDIEKEAKTMVGSFDVENAQGLILETIDFGRRCQEQGSKESWNGALDLAAKLVSTGGGVKEILALKSPEVGE